MIKSEGQAAEVRSASPQGSCRCGCYWCSRYCSFAVVAWQIDGHTHAFIVIHQMQNILTNRAPVPVKKSKPYFISQLAWDKRDAIIDLRTRVVRAGRVYREPYF